VVQPYQDPSNLDRPAIVPEIATAAAALLVEFGA
jgi:hypothetical protein